jgi:hypothetical protein
MAPADHTLRRSATSSAGRWPAYEPSTALNGESASGYAQVPAFAGTGQGQ